MCATYIAPKHLQDYQQTVVPLAPMRGYKKHCKVCERPDSYHPHRNPPYYSNSVLGLQKGGNNLKSNGSRLNRWIPEEIIRYSELHPCVEDAEAERSAVEYRKGTRTGTAGDPCTNVDNKSVEHSHALET